MDPRPNHNATVFGKIAQPYTERYFHDEADLPYIDNFAAAIVPHGRVLDVGCGPGMFTDRLARAGLQATGIDLSPEMIEIARARVPSSDFHVMDMRRLEFANHTFDGMLVAYSLIFIPDHELTHTLSEFHRVLSRSGKALFVTQEGAADHTVAEPMKPDETLYVNFFSATDLRRSLSDAGFSVISQEIVPAHDEYTMADNIMYTLAQRSTSA